MEPLEVDKTVVMRSPIEGDDTLVRTGVIESSLIHAVIQAYSDEYKEMNEKDRRLFKDKLESKIDKKVTLLLPAELPLSKTAKIFNSVIKDFYTFSVKKPMSFHYSDKSKEVILNLIKTEDDESLYEKIFKTISSTTSEKKIFELDENSPINRQIESILKRLRLPSVYQSKMEKLLSNALDVAISSTRHHYVDVYLKELSRRIDRNILILSSETRRLSHTFKRPKIDYPKSIIVVNIKSTKFDSSIKYLDASLENLLFESVSRYDESKILTIENEFSNTDPLIERILSDTDYQPKKSKRDLLCFNSDGDESDDKSETDVTDESSTKVLHNSYTSRHKDLSNASYQSLNTASITTKPRHRWNPLEIKQSSRSAATVSRE